MSPAWAKTVRPLWLPRLRKWTSKSFCHHAWLSCWEPTTPDNLSEFAILMKNFQYIKHVFRFKSRQNCTLSSRSLVPVYRVGELFRQHRWSWPEGSHFSYSPGGHELTVFQAGIHEGMVREVSRGEAEFALIVEAPLLILAYRFGESIAWADASYSWHLQPADWRAIPPEEDSPGERALLWISLVGAADGIIHAQRGMTLSPGFTRALHRAIRSQAQVCFDPHECAAAIARISLNFPSACDRLSLAIARTMGNA